MDVKALAHLIKVSISPAEPPERELCRQVRAWVPETKGEALPFQAKPHRIRLLKTNALQLNACVILKNTKIVFVCVNYCFIIVSKRPLCVGRVYDILQAAVVAVDSTSQRLL